MAEFLRGKVEAVLVNTGTSGVSESRSKIQILAARGIKGDTHFGSTRLADVREKGVMAIGLDVRETEIANHRQFSAIDMDELVETATQMGLASITYGLLGENLVISGIENFSQLPIGTLLGFEKNAQRKRKAVLMVMAENDPCPIPARNIKNKYQDASISIPFQTAAIHRRGVVGVVYCTGVIEPDDVVIAKLP